MRACVFRQENTLSAVLCALRGIAAFNRIHIYKSCLGPAGLLVRRRFTAGANGEAPARAPPSSRGWKEAAVRAMWAALPISPLPPAWCCPSRGTTGSRAADATCPEVDVQCWGCMARQDHAMGSGPGSGGACSCCPSKEPTTPPIFFLPAWEQRQGLDLLPGARLPHQLFSAPCSWLPHVSGESYGSVASCTTAPACCRA